MTIRYPNGKPYHINNDKKTSGNQLKKKKPSYSNRGMTLEEDLNATNAYYLEKIKPLFIKNQFQYK